MIRDHIMFVFAVIALIVYALTWETECYTFGLFALAILFGAGAFMLK